MDSGEASNGFKVVNNLEANSGMIENDTEALERVDTVSNLGRNESFEIRSSRIPNGNTPKMTLQLVLPNQNGLHDNEFDSLQGMHYRRSRPPSRAGSMLESKSPGVINTRLVNYPRTISHQPSVRSHSHFQNDHDSNIPPPSTAEEKSKMTRRYFATVFAICYAIFLVVFGAAVFVGDAAADMDQYPIPEIFCIFMLSVGFAYFIFLFIDIRLHVRKAKNTLKAKQERMRIYEEQLSKAEASLQGPMEFSQNANGHFNLQLHLPHFPTETIIKPVSHRYCFMTGRHGEFLYLKLGAAWFCFGLLTHSILTLSYQIIYFTQDSKCSNILQLTVDIMFPLYSLFLLFFIFKYCNIVINSYRGLARLMLMHAIGTSLAFWIYTIVRETVDAINMKNYDDGKTDDKPTVLPEQLNGPAHSFSELSGEPVQRFSIVCPGPEDLNTIYRNFAPYLYPFIIEFCILIVGIFYMVWSNINHCPKKLSASGHHGNTAHSQHNGLGTASHYPSLHSIPEETHKASNVNEHHRPTSSESDHCDHMHEHENHFKSNIIVYADCHAANRGLFGGMVLMILTIVFVILFHVAVHEPNYIDTGIIVNSSFEVIVLVIMITAVFFAYFQTSKLDINHHPISKLDDVLLFIAIPAFFSETIFSMVPAVINGSFLNITIICAQLMQVLIQTPWICDALRRCSNSVELRKKKPGRELVTFLTIANVSLWIYYTFSVKNADTQDERYYFYGDVLWSILNHLSLPLIMFYRFHASVCLVDVWRHSYEPGEFAH